MYSILVFFSNVEAKSNINRTDPNMTTTKSNWNFLKKSRILFFTRNLNLRRKHILNFRCFFSTLKPFFDKVCTSELAEKFFTRQNSDENAQPVFRSCRVTRSWWHYVICPKCRMGTSLSVTSQWLADKCVTWPSTLGQWPHNTGS